MFTGMVRAVGEVASFERTASGARLSVMLGGVSTPVGVGASVAVAGVCLTVTAAAGDRATFDAVEETLRRTTLSGLAPGARVNIEPALRAGEEIGGHFVLGHVDGVASLRARRSVGLGAELDFAAEAELLRDVVEKGSIAVDGVSLTVARLAPDGFRVAVVPHTLTATTLGALAPGGKVNVETDVLVKAARRALTAGAGQGGMSVDFLREHGFA